MTAGEPRQAPERDVGSASADVDADPMRDADLRLATLRKHRNVSQTAVANKLAVSQPNISRLERTADPKVSRVASYINALGGRLEVRAVFDDETITL